jgi:hypothetical protein
MTAVRFAFYLREATDAIHERLETWAKNSFFDYVIYRTEDRAVLIFGKSDPSHQVALSRGARTVAEKLGLDYTPDRIVTGAPFLEGVLRLTAGHRAPVPLYVRGYQFSQAALQTTLGKTGRLMNPEYPISTLITRGDIEVQEVSSIDQARTILHGEALTNAFSEKEDLEGTLRIEYGLYDAQGRLLPPGPTKRLGARTVVELTGYPGESGVKKKHIYIYSKDGNRCVLLILCGCFILLLILLLFLLQGQDAHNPRNAQEL